MTTEFRSAAVAESFTCPPPLVKRFEQAVVELLGLVNSLGHMTATPVASEIMPVVGVEFFQRFEALGREISTSAKVIVRDIKATFQM